MSKHTEGPWHVDAESSDLFGQDQARIWINADGLQHIGYVDGPRTVERLANAHLIAAAPDLLGALQSLIDMDVAYQRGPKVEEAVETARAAIAKATGGGSMNTQPEALPLAKRLEADAQGIDLGAEGMGWGPSTSNMNNSADELRRLHQHWSCPY